jgi:hypothetical protein
MKIKTLITSAAIAGISSTAFAQNVTTPTGEVVMIEKNQASLGLLGLGGGAAIGLGALVVIAAIAAVSADGGT